MPLPPRFAAGPGPAQRLPAHVHRPGPRGHHLGGYRHPLSPCARTGQQPFRARTGFRRHFFVHARHALPERRLSAGLGFRPAAQTHRRPQDREAGNFRRRFPVLHPAVGIRSHRTLRGQRRRHLDRHHRQRTDPLCSFRKQGAFHVRHHLSRHFGPRRGQRRQLVDQHPVRAQQIRPAERQIHRLLRFRRAGRQPVL